MDIQEAEQTAKQLMLYHGLREWTFRTNRAKRQLGVCKEHSRRIELSEHFILRNSGQRVVDTILHEIAHALVGAKHGHDEVWRNKCLELGCEPAACDSSAEMPEGDWRAQCPSCKKTFSRHRKPKRVKGLYCIACGPLHGSLHFRNDRIKYEKQVEKAVNLNNLPITEDVDNTKQNHQLEHVRVTQLMLKLF